MPAKEIGYGPLTLTPEGAASPLAGIAGQPVLHWHGDQLEMPAGCATLASTPACPNQAFMAGEHAMAWQFHLEVDAVRIEQWLIGHTGELCQAGIDMASLRRAAAQHRVGLAQALDAVLSDWLTRLRL
jgi:GMP synthase (glutamine-hydrolysing)